MINKQWRKRMAVLLAMSMLAAHMPAGAAQETSDAKAVSEETGSASESQGGQSEAKASQTAGAENSGEQAQEAGAENSGEQAQEAAAENSGKQAQEAAAENSGKQTQEAAAESAGGQEQTAGAENSGDQAQEPAAENSGGQTQEAPAESTNDQAQASSGQSAENAASGGAQEATGGQAESPDVSSTAQESTQGAATQEPAQESTQSEGTPAPAQESAQSEVTPAPAQESAQSEATPAPVQESVQSEATPAPAQEGAQSDAAQESAQENVQSAGGETTLQEAGTPEAVPGTQEEAGNGNEEGEAAQEEAGNGSEEEKAVQQETADKADEEEKTQQAAENENAVDETEQKAQTAQENTDSAAGSEGTSGEDAASGQNTTDQNTTGQDTTGQDTAGQNAAGQNAGGAGQAADTVPAGTSVQNNAKVSVSWKDDNDANDVRPGFMTVYLQTSEDGENYDDGTAYELNEKNNWQILLENLPTTKDGKQLHYRWVWDVDLVPGIPPEDQDEYNLVGYTRTRNDDSEDHLQSTREYTHITAKEKYTISIDWDDRGDETAKRPKKLDVTLPDGRVVTLTAKNGWKMDVEMPVVHRDLTWKIGAADGWVSGGSSTDFTEERTQITFTRKWKTKKDKETIETEEVVEEPAGYSTLTVQYWIGSESAAPSFTGVYENGQNYSVVVPRKTGYRTQVTKVKGTISEDTVINVRYIPNSYTVTVYYRYLNGETAAATTQQELLTGSTFDIASPAVNGYAVSAGSISGTVTGRDLTYVVYYTGIVPDNNNGEGRQNEQMIPVAGTATAPAAQQPDTGETEIDEYRTPLGLGEVGINAGECFE